jgi:RNA polymerase sigma-70 factor (ECF subfamily)
MSGSATELIGGTDDAASNFEPLYRTELTRLRARLAVAVGDVAIADKLVQETFAAAIGSWQRDGVPADPGAWLTNAALRQAGLPIEPAGDDDALLVVLLACSDPSLPEVSRVVLTLRFVCGLTQTEIEAVLAETIPALDAAGVAVPVPDERDARPGDAVAVISAIHRRSLSGDSHDPARGELALHAVALVRLLAGGFPSNAGVAELRARLSVHADDFSKSHGSQPPHS